MRQKHRCRKKQCFLKPPFLSFANTRDKFVDIHLYIHRPIITFSSISRLRNDYFSGVGLYYKYKCVKKLFGIHLVTGREWKF